MTAVRKPTVSVRLAWPATPSITWPLTTVTTSAIQAATVKTTAARPIAIVQSPAIRGTCGIGSMFESAPHWRRGSSLFLRLKIAISAWLPLGLAGASVVVDSAAAASVAVGSPGYLKSGSQGALGLAGSSASGCSPCVYQRAR